MKGERVDFEGMTTNLQWKSVSYGITQGDLSISKPEVDQAKAAMEQARAAVEARFKELEQRIAMLEGLLWETLTVLCATQKTAHCNAKPADNDYTRLAVKIEETL